MIRALIATCVVIGALSGFIAGRATAASPAQTYSRIWHQDRRFYAPGMPSPLVTFNARTPGADADTAFVLGGPRVVEVSRGTTRALRRNPTAVRGVIEWEWTRVFGSADQGEAFPRPVTNALLRYRNGHGSPLPLMRSRLTYWGQDPRTVFDLPTCPGELVIHDDGLCYPAV